MSLGLANLGESTRMYKYHFKNWGFRKYVKGGDVAMALRRVHRRAVAGEAVFDLARDVDPVELHHSSLQKTRPHGLRGLKAVMTQSGNRPLASSPIRTHMRLPDDFKLSEECIRSLVDFTRGQLESARWSHASFDENADTSADWTAKVLQAQEVIEKGNLAMGFRLINACFDQYRAIITAQPPNLFSHTLSAILLLSKVGDALANEFIRYIASLYVIVLGPHHPNSRMWSALRRGGIAAVRRYGAVLYDAQYKLLMDCASLPKPHLSYQRLDTLRFFYTAGLLTLAETQTAIEKVVDTVAADVTFSCYTVDNLLWAKVALGIVTHEGGRLADANKAIDFVGRWVVPSPSREGPDYKTKVGYYVVKGRVLEQIGTYEMKTDCHQAFLDMCLRELGPDHRQTTRALNGLEHHYRRSGKIDEADKVHTELEERWARLCETEENHGRAAGPT